MGELNFTKPINANAGDKYGSRGGKHKGIDYPASKGTAVIASEDGVVVRAADNPRKPDRPRAYGNVIIIYHNPGDPDPEKPKVRHLYTLYAHLDEMYVRAGDYVEKHETIGAVGSTGTSTGPHLHFEVIDSREKKNWSSGKGATGVEGDVNRENPEDYFDHPKKVEGTLSDIVERAVMDRIEFVPDIDLKRNDPFRLEAWLDGKNIGYLNKRKDTLKAKLSHDFKAELSNIWRKPLQTPAKKTIELNYVIKAG